MIRMLLMAKGELLALTALAIGASIGCTLDANGVLRELKAIEGDRGSTEQPSHDPDHVARGFVTAALSFGRFSELAERVDKTTEDVLTEAYIRAGTDRQRRDVVRIATMNARSSARYLPLLCYVLQFDRDPGCRYAAARSFHQITAVPPFSRRSQLVRLLGQTAETEPLPHRQEMLWFCLDEFLRNACGYDIPGAQRSDRPIPMNASGSATWRAVRADPAFVRNWWESTGRAMAARGEFDAPAENSEETNAGE